MLAAPPARAGVVFTNLVFFTYTNAPNYGWNNGVVSHPSALVQGDDGNFYGTTTVGGTNTVSVDSVGSGGYGTVFKMTPAGTFTSLYSFGNNPFGLAYANVDGGQPNGNLIKGNDGKFYGTTVYRGQTNAGTIFQITTNGDFSLIYSFGNNLVYDTNADVNSWTTSDGGNPTAGLVQGGDGNFYGTTSSDGPGGGGTVFQFIPGSGLNTLYSFPDVHADSWLVDGGSPESELTEGPDGNFYGTTYWGGTNRDGTIFKITPGGTFTTLHSFQSGAGVNPLLLGKDGNFYGTSGETVFQITTNGTFTTLYQFSGYGDGGYPSGLIQASDGNLYGTTYGGGAYAGPPYWTEGGTIFQMTTNGTLTTLYSFSGPDGQAPQGALVEGKDGNLYGTTSYGGPNWQHSVNSGYGTIFRITIPPVFQTITPTNGGVAFTWSAMSNQVCQVQYSTNLFSTNWINLGGPITATNTTVCASDCMTNPQCYYRIMLLQ